MAYVDGYLLPIPKRNLPAYARMARVAAEVWMEHGALDYYECAGDDLNSKWGLPFTSLIEVVVVATVAGAWLYREEESDTPGP